MRRTFLLPLLLLAACGGGHPPAGQPPLAALTTQNFDQLRERFNHDISHTRLIAMLSPT